MKKITILSFALLGSSCSMMPDYVRPAISFGNSWGQTQLPGNVAASDAPVRADWWMQFGSTELNSLMAQSLAGNQDLAAAQARIAEARGSLRQAGASLLPSVSAGISSNYSKPDLHAGGGTDSAATAQAAYELDLFGRNLSGKRAAAERLEAAGYDRDALALTTASDVAQTYFNLVAMRERVQLTQETVDAARKSLALLEVRLNVGTIGLLDVTQQRTAVAQAEASVASLKEQEAAYNTALAILVGKAPQDFTVSATTLTGLTLPVVPVNAPATLLERRPDLKVAEANLKAANGDIGVARAAFFPSVDLSAGLTQAIDPARTALDLGASVLAPIFSGGANRGALESANARQQEVAATYRQAVLTAFGEASNALSSLQSAQTRETSQQVAAENAATALRLANLQLQAGTIDMPTLLSTQTSDLNAKDAFAQARADALTATVQLMRVMGGGFGSAETADSTSP